MWMGLERRHDQWCFALLKGSTFIPRVMGSHDGWQASQQPGAGWGRGWPVNSTDGE